MTAQIHVHCPLACVTFLLVMVTHLLGGRPLHLLCKQHVTAILICGVFFTGCVGYNPLSACEC